MPRNQFAFGDVSDLQLVDLIRNDNMEAFEEIYRRHWPNLIDAAYKRLQSRQKAEDLVQDFFISFYKRRHSLELTVSLKAYFNQAVKFKVLNLLRDEYTRAACQKEIFLKESLKKEFSFKLETQELSNKIEQTLCLLPDKCRRAFLLSRKEDRTHKDISIDLNISISTVEKHIGKALKILRSNLKNYPFSN